MEEIAQALSISDGSVSTILHDRLGMRRLTARLMPKSLGDEQIATKHQYTEPYRSDLSQKVIFFCVSSGDCR